MAKKKNDKAEEWRFTGCAICTAERNELIQRHIERYGRKPANSDLPFVRMSTVQCRAWVEVVAGFGREHLLAVCDLHHHNRSGVIICTECLNSGPDVTAAAAAAPEQASLFALAAA